METSPFGTLPREVRTRHWAPLGTSALIHAAVILAILLWPAPASSGDLPPSEEVRSVALAPPDPANTYRPPAPRTVARPSPPSATPLGPDAKTDVPVPVEAGPTKPPIDPDLIDVSKASDPGSAAAPPAPEPPPVVEPEPAPASTERSARRIPRAAEVLAGLGSRLTATPTSPWGPPRDLLTDSASASASKGAPAASMPNAMGRVGIAARDNRDWRPSSPTAAGRCVEVPDLGTNADGTPVLATVIGRVFREDGRTPLDGANLVIIGSSFSTFSNSNGDYRLEFDPRLLQRCRVQYVRVSAAGFSGRLLTLSIGNKIISDDVVLRRR